MKALCKKTAALAAFAFLLAVQATAPERCRAHGIAGNRFFPTTFNVEDPSPSDELSLLVGHRREPDAKTTEVSAEFAKSITEDLGISIGESFLHQEFPEGGSANGFANLELAVKYQFFQSDAHETILSLGTTAELGGTGARRVGSESFSTISPLFFFGKGLGDLPQSASVLRPLAVAGIVGPNFPTRRTNRSVDPETGDVEVERNPTTLTWALSLQYSLMYLQSFVRDVGLGDPWSRMILVVEFPMETCLSSGCEGQTTGTASPGIVWAGKSMELGLAAQIPINARSGRDVGVLALFHFFFDDLFPKGLGAPILR